MTIALASEGALVVDARVRLEARAQTPAFPSLKRLSEAAADYGVAAGVSADGTPPCPA